MKNILLFLLTALGMCLALDVFLKYTRITPPTLKYYDAKYGSENRKNIQYFKCIEGLYVGSTNYDGRIRENYSKRKQDKKTLRILLFGDSYVEGIDVFNENHFAQYMEDILKEKLHRNVEVLNFGRGNSIIASNAYYFQDYVAKEYDGDIVIFMTEGRDMADQNGSLGSYPSTLYTFDSNKNLVPAYYWKNTWEYKMHKKLSGYPIIKYYDNFAFFRLAYRAVARIRLDGFPVLTLGKFYSSKSTVEGVNYTMMESHSKPGICAEKIFDTVYKYNHGQVVYVVRNMPVKYPELLEFIKSKNYKYINVDDTFDNYNIKNTKIDAYFFKATSTYGGHWNNDGHKAAGYFLANKILQNIDSYNMPNYEK